MRRVPILICDERQAPTDWYRSPLYFTYDLNISNFVTFILGAQCLDRVIPTKSDIRMELEQECVLTVMSFMKLARKGFGPLIQRFLEGAPPLPWVVIRLRVSIFDISLTPGNRICK